MIETKKYSAAITGLKERIRKPIRLFDQAIVRGVGLTQPEGEQLVRIISTARDLTGLSLEQGLERLDYTRKLKAELAELDQLFEGA